MQEGPLRAIEWPFATPLAQSDLLGAAQRVYAVS